MYHSLLLSILFSSLIFVIFKGFSRYDVRTSYAIVVNYFVACAVGLLFYEDTVNLATIPSKKWFTGAVALGLLFIIVFNLIAATAQKLGVSVASIATKMSFVLPVLFGVLIYEEKVSGIKILGILMAIVAVFLCSKRTELTASTRILFTLPFLVFLGSGTIDITLKYFQEFHVPKEEFALFSASIFAVAGLFGIIYTMIKTLKKPLRWSTKNCIGGIVLGIPNFFSIYFLLKALNTTKVDSVTIFTINNIGIVTISTFLGMLLFNEKLDFKNCIGVLLAITSIILITIF